MYETVNENFHIHHDEQTSEQAAEQAEILNRILCVGAGFTASTYNMDFSIGVPLSSKRNALLTLCNNAGNLYVGIYDADQNKLYMDVHTNLMSKLSANTIDMLLVLLHDNEMYAAINHKFMPVMHSQSLQNAWDVYFNSSEHIKPTQRNYRNVIKRGMSVREFYELSVENKGLLCANKKTEAYMADALFGSKTKRKTFFGLGKSKIT